MSRQNARAPSIFVPGVTVQMGGQDFVVPPLTLGQLRRLMPKVRQMTDIGANMGDSQIEVLIEIVTAGLQRNYPEMTPDKVENMLDLGNSANVLNIILTGSGLKPKGEAQAGMTGMASDSSTVPSPPSVTTPIP